MPRTPTRRATAPVNHTPADGSPFVRPTLDQIMASGGKVRVAIYIRASADEEHQPFSLEAQEHKLGAYVTSQENWALVRTFPERASGATNDRPELQKALAAAHAGQFDVLLVYRVDRLARSIRGLAQILDELDKIGVVFRSATEPFDTATPAGRMMVQMLGVFAEFERATIIDRVINGMERKAARGGWTAGQRPYGYRINKDTGFLSVNDAEAALIPKVFNHYAGRRLGAKAIAAWLNKRGYRTKTGRPWSGESVLTILRNRVYLGEIYFRGQWHTAPHAPLITPELFDTVQRLLTERGEDRAKRAGTASDYLLAGLMTCAHCGKSYVGTAAHGRNGRYRYYTCFTRNRYSTHACQGDRIPADRIETAMLAALVQTFCHTDVIDHALDRYREAIGRDTDRYTAELDALTQKIDTVETSIERYLRAFEAGTMPETVCGPRINELATQLVELRDHRTELTTLINTAADTATPATEQLTHVRELITRVIHTSTPQSQKALLRALTASVTITSRHHIQPRFRVPHPNQNIPTGPLTCGDDPVRVLTSYVGADGLEPPASAL